VGGLVTSAFLTLEIIPVVVTYWRQEQLLWQRLQALDAGSLAVLQRARDVLAAGAALAALAPLLLVYLTVPAWLPLATAGVGLAAFLGGLVVYLSRRAPARRLVWPAAAG
jgi:copper/silver efflux system protein